MRLSFIVCTYNGASRLAETLDALIQACRLGNDCEILVVDNASTDDTGSIAAGILEAAGAVYRVLLEPKQGKANALKLAFKEARGDLFSVIDDDNHVDADWVSTTISYFDAHPDIGLAGPRIVGSFPGGVPPDTYLADSAWPAMLGIVDLGEQEIEDRLPIGAGMTGRTHVMRWLYDQAGTYLSDRVGKKLSSCEDHEKAMLFTRLGWRSVYLPSLGLRHVIPYGRLNQEYVDKVMFSAMRANYWLDSIDAGRVAPWLVVVRMLGDMLRVARHALLPVTGFRNAGPQRRSAYWRRFFWSRLQGGGELLFRAKHGSDILKRAADAPSEVRPPARGTPVA